jgi:hypothetical protein
MIMTTTYKNLLPTETTRHTNRAQVNFSKYLLYCGVPPIAALSVSNVACKRLPTTRRIFCGLVTYWLLSPTEQLGACFTV